MISGAYKTTFQLAYKPFTFNSMGEHFGSPSTKNELLIFNWNSPKPNKPQTPNNKRNNPRTTQGEKSTFVICIFSF